MMSRIITFTCMTFLLAACSGPSDTGAAAKGPPPVTVSLAEAARTPVETRVRALAMVEATHAPQVVAEVTGRVTEVLADVGDTVKAGQPLARLDARDVSASRVSADAEVARLTALADQASRDLRRGRELAQQGFISPSAVDDLVAKSHAASELLSAGRAKAGQASNDEDRAIVRAPIAGRVDARLVAVGDWAAAGKGLFVVNGRQGGLRLRVGLAGRDPRSVQPGQIVRLVTDAGDTLEVPIGEVRPAVDSGSGAIEAIAPLPDTRALTAGQSVGADVVLAQREAITVPRIAVVDRPQGQVVYLASADRNSVSVRPVKTGTMQDDRIEILEGLKAGDTVVADGAGFLTDKARIRVPATAKAAAAGPAARAEATK